MSGEQHSSDEPSPSLDLSPPNRALPPGPWSVLAFNKRVLKGWRSLCERLPENAAACFEWLSQRPTTPIPRRCYPLKHKQFLGCWAYEVGSGDRVYYKPFERDLKVVVYFAGTHPPRVPAPPDQL